MCKTEIIEKCLEVLQKECEDPAEELIKTGNALIGIGNALKGLSLAEARATIMAVSQLVVVAHAKVPNDGAMPRRQTK